MSFKDSGKRFGLAGNPTDFGGLESTKGFITWMDLYEQL